MIPRTASIVARPGSRRHRWLAAASLAVTALGVTIPTPARAEWQPETAASAAVAVRTQAYAGGRGLGAAFAIDAWQRFGVFRLGFGAGVTYIGGADAISRTYVPVGLSLGVANRSRVVGYDLRFRTGPWLGATDKGLAAGYFACAAAHASFRITDVFSITVGVDASLLVVHGNALVVSPGISLVFTPREEP